MASSPTTAGAGLSVPGLLARNLRLALDSRPDLLTERQQRALLLWKARPFIPAAADSEWKIRQHMLAAVEPLLRGRLWPDLESAAEILARPADVRAVAWMLDQVAEAVGQLPGSASKVAHYYAELEDWPLGAILELLPKVRRSHVWPRMPSIADLYSYSDGVVSWYTTLPDSIRSKRDWLERLGHWPKETGTPGTPAVS